MTRVGPELHWQLLLRINELVQLDINMKTLLAAKHAWIIIIQWTLSLMGLLWPGQCRWSLVMLSHCHNITEIDIIITLIDMSWTWKGFKAGIKYMFSVYIGNFLRHNQQVDISKIFGWFFTGNMKVEFSIWIPTSGMTSEREEWLIIPRHTPVQYRAVTFPLWQ